MLLLFTLFYWMITFLNTNMQIAFILRDIIERRLVNPETFWVENPAKAL